MVEESEMTVPLSHRTSTLSNSLIYVLVSNLWTFLHDSLGLLKSCLTILVHEALGRDVEMSEVGWEADSAKEAGDGKRGPSPFQLKVDDGIGNGETDRGSDGTVK